MNSCSRTIFLLALFLCAATDAFATSVFPRGGGRLKKKIRIRPSKTFPPEPSVTTASPLPLKDDPKTSPTASTQENNKTTRNPLTFLQSIDGIVFTGYLCNIVALTLPILLLPVAAAEHATSTSITAVVAGISSVATLGGAVGKFTNGFICQSLGSYKSSKYYLLGLGVCSLLFSSCTTPSTLGLAYAGMEFCASMQWAALTVMLSSYYETNAAKLAAAMTILGLSSSSGQIFAKTLGPALVTQLHWRQVAQLGAAVACLGSFVVSRAPVEEKQQRVVAARQSSSSTGVRASLKAVLGSKIFWILALAHSVAFCGKGTERILGPFFQQTAGVPASLAGGFTLSITLGLIHGLVTGNHKLSQHTHISQKKTLFQRRYMKATAAAVGLTLAAHYGRPGMIMTGAIALLSSIMASSLAFQYFQFPSMIARMFGHHKAVCISFIDGFGFLLSAPVFASIGRLVPTMGWSSAWMLMAGLFAVGGTIMMRNIPHVLEPQVE